MANRFVVAAFGIASLVCSGSYAFAAAPGCQVKMSECASTPKTTEAECTSGGNEFVADCSTESKDDMEGSIRLVGHCKVGDKTSYMKGNVGDVKGKSNLPKTVEALEKDCKA